MKEIIQELWNALKEDVINVIEIGVGFYVAWLAFIVIIAGFIFYSVGKGIFGKHNRF